MDILILYMFISISIGGENSGGWMLRSYGREKVPCETSAIHLEWKSGKSESCYARSSADGGNVLHPKFLHRFKLPRKSFKRGEGDAPSINRYNWCVSGNFCKWT